MSCMLRKVDGLLITMINLGKESISMASLHTQLENRGIVSIQRLAKRNFIQIRTSSQGNMNSTE